MRIQFPYKIFIEISVFSFHVVHASLTTNQQNNEMFMNELRTKFKLRTSYLSMYAPQTYDAVWAIALALRGAEKQFKKFNSTTSTNYLKLDRFDYTRQDMAYEFLKQLGTLNFLGVSVSFHAIQFIIL